tara:strand:- start:45 stop:395 length:351 start_codon:yes stop_codon:yes gene_type:complete
MKAFIEKGIDESKIELGTVLEWGSPKWGMYSDIVSYIERDENGAITAIGFASYLKIFTNRHKFWVFETDAKTTYNSTLGAVQNWIFGMIRSGKMTLAVDNKAVTVYSFNESAPVAR